MIVTICYGQKKKFNSRKEAIKFYFDCMCCSEGAERERYVNIYMQLMVGKEFCSDEVQAIC